jgi:hypothetical protein
MCEAGDAFGIACDGGVALATLGTAATPIPEIAMLTRAVRAVRRLIYDSIDRFRGPRGSTAHRDQGVASHSSAHGDVTRTIFRTREFTNSG